MVGPPKKLSKAIATPILESLQTSSLDEIKERPMVRNVDSIRDKVKELHGIDIGTAHVPSALSNNAMFVHPTESKPYIRKVLRRKYIPEELKEKLREARGRHGTVLTGKHMKRRGVLEHEYGHGIASAKGNLLERISSHPAIMQYRGAYHKLPAMIAGILAGKKGMTRGALAGAGVGLLTDAPRLYAEHSANQYAKDLMTDEQKQDVSYVRPMIGNMLSATAPYALIGAMSGLGHKIKYAK